MLNFLTQRKNRHIVWLLWLALHAPQLAQAQTGTVKSVNDLNGSNVSSLTIKTLDPSTSKPSGGTAVLLYNPKTQMSIYAGGDWGDHAVLSTTTKFFYLAKDSNNPDGGYLIWSEGNIADQGQFLAYAHRGQEDGLFVHSKYESGSKDFANWILEPVKADATNQDYSYRIKCKAQVDGKSLYITATPPYNCEALSSESLTGNVTEENQEWKLIRKGDYKKLYYIEVNTQDKNMDITSLVPLKDPSFDHGNTDFATSWKTEGFDSGEICFGITGCTRTPQNTTYTQTCSDDYLRDNSQYMCGEIKGETNGSLYQDITLNWAGWYILKCKGATNANYPCLFAIKRNGYINSQTYIDMPQRTFLQRVSQEELNPGSDLTQASQMINNSDTGDKYEHELLFYVSPAELAKSSQKVMVRIGITTNMETAGDSLYAATKSADDYTVFDDFRLEYAGTDPDFATFEKYTDEEPLPDRTRTNSFFLREAGTCDMNYLQKTQNEYSKKPMYLLRTFQPNKWNTICLPLAIKRTEFYRAFGKNTQLAELGELTENCVRFYSIKDDGREVMIEPFKAYLIKPTQSYNTVPFYGSQKRAFYFTQYGDNVHTNKNWFLQQKAAAGIVNNFVILNSDVPRGNITLLDNSQIEVNFPHARQDQIQFRVAPCNETNTITDGKMKAYGILGRNYATTEDDNKDVALKSPLLRMEDAYIFTKDCHFKYVKNGAHSLGFRCFFKFIKDEDATGDAKDYPELWIDGIHDEATRIEDIVADEEETTPQAVNYANAVYSVSGQLIRQGDTSLSGLPKGIYIVEGKKLLVK